MNILEVLVKLRDDLKSWTLNLFNNYEAKIESIISVKMDKTNPSGTGSFSLNRKSGTTVGNYSTAEGYNTTASSTGAHAEGYYTIADGPYQHVEGKFNVVNSSALHIVGNGSSASSRSNAYMLD